MTIDGVRDAFDAAKGWFTSGGVAAAVIKPRRQLVPQALERWQQILFVVWMMEQQLPGDLLGQARKLNVGPIQGAILVQLARLLDQRRVNHDLLVDLGHRDKYQ